MATTAICNPRPSLHLSSPPRRPPSPPLYLRACCFLHSRPYKGIAVLRSTNPRFRLSRTPNGGFAVTCKATPITENEFPTVVLQSDIPVLVEFVANWCGPCRLISPIVDWASQEYKDKLKVVKIDHDSNPKVIEDYKVYGLPTLILFKNGQEVPESRREGAMTKVKLKEYLDTLLESVTTV